MTRPDAVQVAALLDGWLEDSIHIYPLKVQYEDTDLAGIVFHPRFINFAERGRSAMIRRAGIDQNAMRDDGMVFAIRRIGIDYRAPARLGDALMVRTSLRVMRGAVMELDQIVLKQNPSGQADTVMAELTVEVLVMALSGRPMRIPALIRDRITATIS